MDKNLMKSYMARWGDTQNSLARALGISLSCLNAKINGKTDFWGSEIAFIKKRYSLTPLEVNSIFLI